MPDSEAASQHNLPARGRANEERFRMIFWFPPDPPVFGVANDLKKVRFLARSQRNRSDTRVEYRLQVSNLTEELWL